MPGFTKPRMESWTLLYRDCSRLALSGFVEEDTLLYYDPLSHDLLTRPLDYRFKWTSDNEGLKIPNDSVILSPNITYSPPYDDTWYILTVTDELGMVEVDSVFYESIQTKAEFSVTYYDKITGEYDSTLNSEFDKDFAEGKHRCIADRALYQQVKERGPL